MKLRAALKFNRREAQWNFLVVLRVMRRRSFSFDPRYFAADVMSVWRRLHCHARVVL
ncbi:hypothetical protein [Tardiphaga robiniae]|uniref:hypothetical protein n=1 Tax=Tardiphaga robiniae TaxID=943830 RepID=UPI0019564940|nr:hypothetical protein [Tardiphaga robiniae]